MMSKTNLPELPEMPVICFDESVCVKGYTASQMEAYAAAAVLLNARPSVIQKIIDWLTND